MKYCLPSITQEVSDRARNRNHISHVLCRGISSRPCPVAEPLIQTKAPTQDLLCKSSVAPAMLCSETSPKFPPTLKALREQQLWMLRGKEGLWEQFPSEVDVIACCKQMLDVGCSGLLSFHPTLSQPPFLLACSIHLH